MAEESLEVRDSSIQIFDRFVGVCISENKNILENYKELSLTAAVCILLASKMHETKPLSIVSFKSNHITKSYA